MHTYHHDYQGHRDVHRLAVRRSSGDEELLPIPDLGLHAPSNRRPFAEHLESPTEVLRLQHMYGNRYVQRQLSDPTIIQRCGATPCNCPPEEKAAHAARTAAPWFQRTSAAIQRGWWDQVTGAASSAWEAVTGGGGAQTPSGTTAQSQTEGGTPAEGGSLWDQVTGTAGELWNDWTGGMGPGAEGEAIGPQAQVPAGPEEPGFFEGLIGGVKQAWEEGIEVAGDFGQEVTGGATEAWARMFAGMCDGIVKRRSAECFVESNKHCARVAWEQEPDGPGRGPSFGWELNQRWYEVKERCTQEEQGRCEQQEERDFDTCMKDPQLLP